MSNTSNSEATPTLTVIPETVGEIQKALQLKEISIIEKFQGCSAIYRSEDVFSSYFSIFIWKIPNDLPPNSEHGFKFMYSVEKEYGGTVKVATGYAETLNEACETAWLMRKAALKVAIQRYDPSPQYRETLEKAIKKRQFMSRFHF